MMPEITRAVGVPRVLVVPFGLGCPFGAAGEPDIQTRVLRQLLSLCEREDFPVTQNFSGGNDLHSLS